MNRNSKECLRCRKKLKCLANDKVRCPKTIRRVKKWIKNNLSLESFVKPHGIITSDYDKNTGEIKVMYQPKISVEYINVNFNISKVE